MRRLGAWPAKAASISVTSSVCMKARISLLRACTMRCRPKSSSGWLSQLKSELGWVNLRLPGQHKLGQLPEQAADAVPLRLSALFVIAQQVVDVGIKVGQHTLVGLLALAATGSPAAWSPA